MPKNVENNKDGGILSPESDPSKPESFKAFLYNPKTGAVLGRTPGSWCKNFRYSNVEIVTYHSNIPSIYSA
jgi:hypothetical protein